jgi:transcriptional regulator with XRE-family HTH domain
MQTQTFSPTRLRELRLAQGFSRDQLAFAVRRNSHQIGAWERGRDVPNNASLQRLCQALKCRIEDLYTDEDSAAAATAVRTRKSKAENERVGSSRLQGGAAPTRSSKKGRRS